MANIQILIPPDRSADQVVNQAEKAVLSLGYVKQPPDPTAFGGVEARDYKKGSFEISYVPEEGDYKRIAVWLSFYEWDNYVFSARGIAE